MSTIVELNVPINFKACMGCEARSKHLADLIASVATRGNIDPEAKFETSTECFGLGRSVEMSTVARIYNPIRGINENINGYEVAHRTKTLRAIRPCPAHEG